MLLNRSNIPKLGGSLKRILFRSATPFCSFYQTLNKYNKTFYDTEHRASSMKFTNQGISMNVFAHQPFIVQEDDPPRIFIGAGKIMSLTFLDVDQEIDSVQIWDQRKTCPFNFRNTMELFKLGPRKKDSLELEFIRQNQEGENTNFYHRYFFEYSSQKHEVNLSMQYFKKESQDLKSYFWNINFRLTYNEYLALLEWIRTSIYYTSGMAIMVENSKQKELLKAALTSRGVM